MRLNKAQTDHLAGTAHMLAFVQLALFVYLAWRDWTVGWPPLLASVAIFALLEATALWLKKRLGN